MLVFEFKAYGKQSQFNAVDEAIRTAKFIRDSCLRYWMDNKKVGVMVQELGFLLFQSLHR